MVSKMIQQVGLNVLLTNKVSIPVPSPSSSSSSHHGLLSFLGASRNLLILEESKESSEDAD